MMIERMKRYFLFYNDYINKVLFSGSYFKVIDISAEDRFDEE